MTDGAQIAYYIWNRDLKLSHVAKVLGISTSTLKNKLSGRTDFKVSEADTLSSLLGLTPAQRDLCFFCKAPTNPSRPISFPNVLFIHASK